MNQRPSTNKHSGNNEPKEFEEKVIRISRVSKKTKGGNNVGFSVLMVVGDKKGRVGVGLGKAKDVIGAIKKGIKKAKKKMITVPLDGTTIPFPITVKKGAGIVMLKPAPKGSGVIAGGPVRAVVEAAGVRDISSKILGSENQASSVYATFEALTEIQKIVELKGIKLKSIAQVEAEEAEKIKKIQEQAKK
ncbi:MAG: 30S ribosomal protein S5 [Candidatus Pacebacteria bacterium CG_4_10_14_3_um_filter_34_15]|nr:30S ribosomal protein S5 [Candidatus Pacearchaeota archaeon]NCQ65263.1 30S ribosomal protein S5 [Candidatus Paceibacterota bacterium]OIO45010.1 MAG: 30S ribosomal protein S5 [Candidatus Pacebacteria bacterium CG1_02_43_31]PIQ81042.1 MAG: 30S ribosomal protein S5 [Candidatus Pacebacteria bacterium CG11_big_fil_rev_8_21_14_0_20_34_55]PIX81859.1 MAG: 30S ribosomal protein S5 [Candidatus Pacebacteria bacterium CG_4_10_14_3_um_filter_34_15]PJC44074.1 MAG: 30S ribosomal protein S5 [Candidatus Pac